MPFILCATICCCLPCIISVLGFREDATQTQGATPESIDALPTYKFKLKKSRSGNDRESNSGVSEGGVVATGTEKERVISGEDAVSLSFFWIHHISSLGGLCNEESGAVIAIPVAFWLRSTVPRHIVS